MFIANLFKPRWWLEAEKDCLTNAVNDFGAVAGVMALKSAPTANKNGQSYFNQQHYFHASLR